MASPSSKRRQKRPWDDVSTTDQKSEKKSLPEQPPSPRAKVLEWVGDILLPELATLVGEYVAPASAESHKLIELGSIAFLPTTPEEAWIEHACAYGQVELVRKLHAAFPHSVHWTTKCMDRAAMKGHLPVVEFLHRERTEGCTTYAMDWAAKNGRIPVVDFLHRERKEGCTKAAMDWAAINGHLPVVEFLHRERKEGCTTYAMDWAAINGRLPVVDFLKGDLAITVADRMTL